MSKDHLTCACCDEYAGKWEQHWNQDVGYGVCKSCIPFIMSHGMDKEAFELAYGKPGVNYEAPDTTAM